ncbi:TPA: hypothetical protein ACHLAY_004599, partial [Escherichia coli]
LKLLNSFVYSGDKVWSGYNFLPVFKFLDAVFSSEKNHESLHLKVDRLFYRHKNENTTSYFITEYLVKMGNFATQLKHAAGRFFYVRKPVVVPGGGIVNGRSS